MIAFEKYIFRQFRRRQTKLHHLTYLFWECTTRCNLNCLHCGSDCSKDSTNGDMPLSDFLNAIDTIKSPLEKITVVITGGEPLLRNDLEKCGMEIRKRGMYWGMVTNGYLYDKNRHISLLNAGLCSLTISIDGLEDSHNWLRNNKNSFVRVDNAISLAVSSQRVNFDVVTCVNSRNFNQLEQIKEYLIDKGVKSWRLFTIVPIGRAKDNPDMFLSDHQFEMLMNFISEARNDGDIEVKFSCEGFVGHYEKRVRDTHFFCRAGINIGSILIDGSIAACPNIDRSFCEGNIYKDNFYEVWQTKYDRFRDRSWTKTGKCANCSDYKDCIGNGFHYWHGDKKNPLVCHNEKIKNSKKTSY